jgi:hypothetical protein
MWAAVPMRENSNHWIDEFNLISHQSSPAGMRQSVLLHTFPSIINPFSHGFFRVSRLTAVGCNAGKNEEGWGMWGVGSGVCVYVYVCSP